MSVSFAPTKLSVPEGWEALLNGFAREVLRDQPADIYAFGAEYFKNEYIKKAQEAAEDGSETESDSSDSGFVFN